MTVSAFAADELPALLDLLYDAALNKDQWPSFLQALIKPFDGANGVLHFFDIESQTTPLAHTFGLELEYLIGYQEYFSTRNPYPVQTFGKLPILQVRPATFVLSTQEAERTEFYNDWMKPQGISLEHLGCVVHKDDREMVVLAISPDAKKLEKHADRYTKQFEMLAPHLRRAVALSKVSRADPVRGGLTAQLSCAAILMSSNRTVRAVNPPAESLLREESMLSIDPLGRLRLKDTDTHSAFLAATESVFGRRQPIGGPVQCRLSLGESRLTLFVLKLPMAEAELALVLLIVKPVGSVTQTSAPFTAAEARLANALLEGYSLGDFSERMGVSINTARKQLAALFAKTGTNRQAALVAWLLQRST